MSDMWLDWNSDLVITTSGSVQFSSGWDQVRQRIIRRIVTNSAGILPDKTFSPADDIFAPDFGVGLGKLVDQAFDESFEAELQRRIAQGVLEDEDVNSTIPPSIVFQRPNPMTLVIVIGVTLITGISGTISILARNGSETAASTSTTSSTDFSDPFNSQFLPGLI